MSSSSTVSRPATSSQSRLAGRLYVFCLLLFLTLSGGRIASSDGNTMYQVSESLLRGTLAIPEGWNGAPGRDGNFYAKADPGQAVLALPWVVAGKLTAALVPARPEIRALWPRVVASTLNAFVAAGAVVAFMLFVCALGYAERTALALAIGLGVATPLLPYSKSFLREPLLMLAALVSVLDLKRGNHARAGVWFGLGMLVKSSLVLNLPFLIVYVIALQRREHLRAWPAIRGFIAAPLAAAALLAFHNWLRFESITQTGYDPTVDNFSTPLLVGLYGQLLSSGKSLFLYAPLCFAALWAYRRFLQRHPHEGRLAVAIVIGNLVLHAKFASWAGEGSWGPRYMVPFLPWLLLPAAELLATERRWPRRAVLTALALGVVIQIGGSAIYFGSYMRELGEYPYTRNFTDPLFMVRSHFVPNFSPVVGHWRLLVRNAGRLFGNERPRLEPRTNQGRLPIGAEDVDELRYVVDFWFCYALYARLPGGTVALSLVAAVGLTIAAAARLARAIRAGP